MTRSQRNTHPQVIIHGSLARNLRQHESPYRHMLASQLPSPSQSTTSFSTGLSGTPTSPHRGTQTSGSSGPAAGPSPAENPSMGNVSSPSAGLTSGDPSKPATQPSAALRERSRSGAQTPKDMVWVDSKDRLSEMATNIRGISNALSNVALAVAVKSVLIVSKLSDHEIHGKTREVTEWLLNWSPESYAATKAVERRTTEYTDKVTKDDQTTEYTDKTMEYTDKTTKRMIKASKSTTPYKPQFSEKYSLEESSSIEDRVKDRNGQGVFRFEQRLKEDDEEEIKHLERKKGKVYEYTDTFTEESEPCSPDMTGLSRPDSRSGSRRSSISMVSGNRGLELAVEPRSCSQGGLIVYVEQELVNLGEFDESIFKNAGYKDRLRKWNPETVARQADQIDLIITLGGDGTVLYTSWLFQKMVPPTVSFGLGSLGFMTENNFDEYKEVLNEHLTRGICCALRMRFECTVMRTRNSDKVMSDDLEREIRAGEEASHFTTHTREGNYTILNEVVVDRGPNPFVTMTELYGDFQLLTCIKADGVVISTPTGSTAYSMSAGGSLVHPDIPARLISPICPHTLSFRPLVVPDSMVLHIGVPYDARSSAFVSFDGKARVELRRGDFLAINVSRYPFPKVLPSENTSVSWVQQLSRTLHWNEQKRPKRYTDGKTDNWVS